MNTFKTNRLVLNLLTGERYTSTDENAAPTVSELLAHALKLVKPDAPDGFAALLECAGEPRYRYTGHTIYNTKNSPTGAARCDFVTIVAAFPGYHFAAGSDTISCAAPITSKINADGEAEEHNAYTPEQNIRGLVALNMVDAARPLTEAEQAAADKARAAYVDSIADE